MGILDSLTNMSPEQTQGLLAFAANTLQGANTGRPMSFGGALGGGIQAYQQSMDAQRKTKAEQEREAQLQQLRALEIQSQTGTMQQQGSMRDQQAAIDAAAQGSVTDGRFDSDAFLQKVQGISPLKALEYQRMLTKSGPEFDTRPQTAVGPDGKPFQYILSKTGEMKRLDGALPRDKLELANLGGRDLAYNPFALQPGQTFQRTQTPDSAASNATAIRGQNISRQNAQDALATPSYNQEAGGFITRPTAASPGGAFTPLAGAPARGPKMTEDQGKATGWLVQAENAFANMKAVGLDKTGNPTAAAKPGLNDAIGAIPGMGAVANKFRTADRQKFIQSSSSLSEALLRAATGAGVNKDEAVQKVQELTPIYGEDATVTKQKFDAIPLYIDSLKVRAGPGAALAEKVLSNRPAAPASGGWSIQRVGD